MARSKKPKVAASAPAPAPPSLRDDMKQVAQMAGVVATVLSMLSLGLPAILAWVTEHLGPAIPIWKAFATTAPLTVAVALIGVGLIRGWLDGPGQFLYASAGALIATGAIGYAVGVPGWINLAAVWPELSNGIFQLPIAVAWLFLENYWRIYGPQMFASSFVVGTFLAWAWGVKILPHLDGTKAAAVDSTAKRAA